MNPKLRRKLGSEFFGQLQRIRVVANTNRGELVVTDGEPRIFRVTWRTVTVGFSDEPWDDPGKLRINAIIGLEKLGGTFVEGGVGKKWPNWWICSVSLQGWYRQDAFIDDKLVLSKPQVSVWERVNEAQPAYGLFKLGEHPPLILPRNLRVRWNLKWGIESYLTHVPPLSKTLQRWGLVDRFLGLRRWVDL